VGPQWNLEAERACFPFPNIMGREEPCDSHPIINEWGRAWVVPRPGEGGP
jgi:hypothetical protein